VPKKKGAGGPVRGGLKIGKKKKPRKTIQEKDHSKSEKKLKKEDQTLQSLGEVWCTVLYKKGGESGQRKNSRSSATLPKQKREGRGEERGSATRNKEV